MSVCMFIEPSEGLILLLVVVKVVVVLWVVEVIRLMAIVAMTDDRMLDAFALQLILPVNSL